MMIDNDWLDALIILGSGLLGIGLGALWIWVATKRHWRPFN